MQIFYAPVRSWDFRVLINKEIKHVSIFRKSLWCPNLDIILLEPVAWNDFVQILKILPENIVFKFIIEDSRKLPILHSSPKTAGSIFWVNAIYHLHLRFFFSIEIDVILTAKHDGLKINDRKPLVPSQHFKVFPNV